MNVLTRHLEQISERPSPAVAPEWVNALRQRGKDRFVAHGLPNKRVEAWRYTPMTALEGRIESMGSEEQQTPSEAVFVDGLNVQDAVVIRVMDGKVDLGQNGVIPGVRLRTLREAIAEDGANLAERLGGLDIDDADQSMEALNTADLGSGVVIEVAEGVDAGTVLLQVGNSARYRNSLINLRIIVDLAPGATLRCIEHYELDGAHNVVSQILLGADSELHHGRLQENQAHSWLVTFTDTQQQTHSRYHQTSLDLGTGLTRHSLKGRLAESGAKTVLRGAYFSCAKAHLDHHLNIRHEAPGCHSEQNFRGVVKDHARAVFAGRVHVLPGADDSEAHQSNANLLLSRDGEVDTKPELIIEADEVVASHGATVGQLDEKSVFYLRSRGLDEASARQILTTAFCRSVLDDVEVSEIGETFMSRLDRALDGLT